MYTIKNLEEAKKLAKRYRSITLEELKEAGSLEILTGFGDVETCSLCTAANDCYYCIHSYRSVIERISCTLHSTYIELDLQEREGTSFEDYLPLLKKRAEYIESLIQKVEEE